MSFSSMIQQGCFGILGSSIDSTLSNLKLKSVRSYLKTNFLEYVSCLVRS